MRRDKNYQLLFGASFSIIDCQLLLVNPVPLFQRGLGGLKSYMRYLPYNRNLKQLCRDLRNNSTTGEISLWKQLRARSMMGYQFYRQKPLDNFIIDFYCPALQLIIEIDGKYHGSEEEALNDDIRQKKLEEWNLNFLRFSETEVRKDMINVLRTIEHYIFEYEEKHPEVLKRNHRKGNPSGPL